MIGFVLGLLPSLTDWVPEILGGGGALGIVAGFLPRLRTYVVPVLAVLLAVAVIGLLWFRGEHEACKAGRIADAAAAEKAASEKVAAAKKTSDAKEAELRVELGANRATADIYRDMIANAQAPSCPPSGAARAASRGLGVLLSDPSPAGAAATR